MTQDTRQGSTGFSVAHPDMLSAFRATVQKHGDRIAVRYFDGKLTFADLDRRSDTLAVHLARVGFERGDRLAVCLQNDPSFVVALLAAWKLGGAAVAMNPMYRRREVEELLVDSGARLLISMDEDYHDVAEPLLAAGTTPLRAVILVSGFDDQGRDDARVLVRVPSPREAQTFASIIAEPAGLPAPATPAPHDLAVLMYTSGTTACPKGAMITHGRLTHASEVYRHTVNLTCEDRILAVAPLFHITGLVGHVCAALLTGASLVMSHRFNSDVVMDAIIEHRPTFTVGAITMFNNLASRPDAVRGHFESLRAVYSGGAPIAPALAATIAERTGFMVHNLYGMTETTGPVIGVPFGAHAPVDPTSGALSIGRPMFGTAVRIADDDGTELAPGRVGELVIAGPQVIAEYWNRPQETAQRISGDAIATGDVGFRDSEGWIYLVDRKTDVINASGYKVWPREVEDALYTHPAVREASVVGVPDTYRGETVKAFVVRAAGTTVTAEELQTHCRARMAAYKYPRTIEFCDELPKSITGKVLRRALRERVAAAGESSAT